jgi:hypothetical protein
MDDKQLTARDEIGECLKTFWRKHEKLAGKLAKELIEWTCPDCYVTDRPGWETCEGEVFISVLVHSQDPEIDAQLFDAANRLEAIFGLAVDLWHCKVDHHVTSKSYVPEPQDGNKG